MGRPAFEEARVLSKETARRLPEPHRFQIIVHFTPIPFSTFGNPRPGLPPFAIADRGRSDPRLGSALDSGPTPLTS